MVGQTQLTLSVGDKQITHSFAVVQDFAFAVVLATFCDLSAPSLATRMVLSHLAALVQVKKPHSLFSAFLPIRMALLLLSTLLVLLTVFEFLLSRSLFLHYWIRP